MFRPIGGLCCASGLCSTISTPDISQPLTDPLPIQKRSLGGLVFKIFAWACAVLLALIVVGAAALFVSGEIDAAVYCVRPTYHSAECKDIRHLQLAMIVFDELRQCCC